MLLFDLYHFPSQRCISGIQCHLRCLWVFCLAQKGSGYRVGMCNLLAFPCLAYPGESISVYLVGLSWSVRARLWILGKAANIASCFLALCWSYRTDGLCATAPVVGLGMRWIPPDPTRRKADVVPRSTAHSLNDLTANPSVFLRSSRFKYRIGVRLEQLWGILHALLPGRPLANSSTIKGELLP